MRTKTTLGINLSHNASLCIYGEDGMEYYEEDRFHRVKNWEPDPERMGEDVKYHCFDRIKYKKYQTAYASIDRSVRTFMGRKASDDKKYIHKIQKILNKQEEDYFFNPDYHHLYHAICGFYFSKFEEAVGIVIDGGGAKPISAGYAENESIFLIDKKDINLKYCHYSNLRYLVRPPFEDEWVSRNNFIEESFDGVDCKFSMTANPAFKYEIITAKLQLGDGFSAGKTMGLSSYADTNIKYELDYEKVKQAKELQDWSLNYTIELINKAKTYSDCKNYVLSGGYFLNCTNNYKLLKAFPDINFFVDPICHDGGTAIGVAVYYRDYIKN